jgi:nucleoside-diphosphate-sugar epimerase
MLERAGITCWIPQRDDSALFEKDLGAVFYCAGVNAASSRKVYESERVHIGLTAEILSRATFDSFLYLSSTRVYMGAARGDEEATLSVNPTNSDHLFNVTKLAGEAVCLNDDRRAVRVARVANVFGPGARPGTFLPSIISAALRERRVILKSTPDTAKDYLSIDDCVRALMAVAQRGTDRLYNVASGNNVAHAEITDRLARRTGAIIEVETGAPKINYPIIDVKRLRKLLPEPPVRVVDALDDLIRSYEETV